MEAQYLEERAHFIAADRALRVDAHAHANATEKEKRAEAIVRGVRARENVSVWGPGAPPIPDAMHVFPGMSFLTGMSPCGVKAARHAQPLIDPTAKETIMKTQLFEIVSKVRPHLLLTRDHRALTRDLPDAQRRAAAPTSRRERRSARPAPDRAQASRSARTRERAPHHRDARRRGP